MKWWKNPGNLVLIGMAVLAVYYVVAVQQGWVN